VIRSITIRFDDTPGRGSFDVADDTGRVADGLAFDEMLGQVISLTNPTLRAAGRPRIPMSTPAEHDQRRREREAQHAENEARRKYGPQCITMPEMSAGFMVGDGTFFNRTGR
jgi:hypothetical protein